MERLEVGDFAAKNALKLFSTASRRAEINQRVSESLKGRPSNSKGKSGKPWPEEDRIETEGRYGGIGIRSGLIEN